MQPPLLSPSSPAVAGGPRREVRSGSGSMSITWGQSPTAETSSRMAKSGSPHGAAGRKVGVRELSRCPKPAAQPAPPRAKIKRPTPWPLRPQPRSPLRSVTRTASAGSGFHWLPRRPQAPPTAHGRHASSRTRAYPGPERPPGPAPSAGRCAGAGLDVRDSSLLFVLRQRANVRQR